MFAHNRFLFLTFSDVFLKIISVNLVGSKPEIFFSAQRSLPTGVVFDDKVIDFVRFKEEVRRFFAENQDNFKSSRVVLALNEQEVFLDRLVIDSLAGNLKSEISKYLEPRLPYSLSEATVRFRKSSTNSLQLIITKHQLIRDLVSIFENTQFELNKLEPLPLPCSSLLAEEVEPYIFVLSEDQMLEFGLVIKGIVVFSSSLKLLRNAKESQKEFVATIKKLIEVEYERNKVANTPLRNIFIVGQDADSFKNFLESEDLKPVVIDLLEGFQFTDSSDIQDYSKALLTASAAKELLSFSKEDDTGINVKNQGHNLRFPVKKFLLVIFLLAIILLAAIGVLFYLPLSPNKVVNKQNDVQKLEQINSKPTASTSAEKAVETPIPTPTPPTLNKTELKMQILNGTTTKGLAGQTRDFLVSKGYSVTNIGNAESSSYDQTIIKFKVSKEVALDDLTKVLSERYSVIRGDHLNESDQFDIIIIVGRK